MCAPASTLPVRRPGPGAPPLEVRWLGRVPYGEALELQRALIAERRAGAIPDQLLLLEHDHVITLGTSASAEHVLLGPDERRLLGIELFETGRGGDVTYHGPGQLVGYPILALEPARRDLHRYVRDLEQALIQALAGLDITATRLAGLTGVWVGERKIAAIGVRVSSGWITSHGFALNVATELSFFDAIVPCGIRDRAVTSIDRERTGAFDRRAAGDRVAAELAAVFGRAPSPVRDESTNTSRRT
ncbi:MAG: lipoyl(octanoyl) transferase LipB [Longimicrobiales bacterium]